jgi:hypothetical protein
VNGFYRMVGSRAWRIDGVTGVASFQSVHDTIFYLTNDCTGPAYVENSWAVGSTMSGDYPSGGRFEVSSTTVSYTMGDPLSGYDPNIGGGTQCENGGAGGLGPNSHNTQAVRLLTPVADVPAVIPAPLTYDR